MLSRVELEPVRPVGIVATGAETGGRPPLKKDLPPGSRVGKPGRLGSRQNSPSKDWPPAWLVFIRELPISTSALWSHGVGGDERLFVYGGLLWLFFHVWVVGLEEPELVSRFGTEYEDFRANVPRWIPRMTPWRST
jgi:hypothetical protein